MSDAVAFRKAARRFPVGAYAAAAWAVLFALVHVYWLAGGRAGLPAGQSLFDNVPLLVVDVAAIPLSLAGAVLALALVRPWGARISRRWLSVGVWGTAGLLLVHALPTVPDWVGLAAGTEAAGDLGADERFITLLYEPWFFAGGVLFVLAGLAFRGSPVAQKSAASTLRVPRSKSRR